MALHHVPAKRRAGGGWQLEIDERTRAQPRKRGACDRFPGEVCVEAARMHLVGFFYVKRREAHAVDGDTVAHVPAACQFWRRNAETDVAGSRFDL